jgi:hypothetical protein
MVRELLSCGPIVCGNACALAVALHSMHAAPKMSAKNFFMFAP